MLPKLRLLVLSFALVTSFLILGVSTPVLAQNSSTSSTISGVITDQQGAVLPGVTVSVKNLTTGIVKEINTNDEGKYQFAQLPPGNYEVNITAENFTGRKVETSLDLGTASRLDVALSIAASQENIIEVRADVAVQEGKTESSTNIDKGRIDSLPINKRNFLDFTLTSARATIARENSQGITETSGISFNGQSSRNNNITIDGLTNNNILTGSVRSTFSQEAVQEFQVVSDSFSAEFGRAFGGVVNIVTKGGSNDFHSRVFFIYRSDSVSARDVFAPFKPPFEQDQFGATLSGPIKKNKAFFFTSFERFIQKQNNFVTISDATVAAARRQGFNNFSTGAVATGLAETSFLGRTDIQLSPNNLLTARFNFAGKSNTQFEPFGGLSAETEASSERPRDNTFALSNVYTNLKLNLVNETRFLFSHRTQRTAANNPGPDVSLFLPEGQVRFGRTQSSGPFNYDEDIFQIVNNTTLFRGNNQIKFGIDYAQHNLDGMYEPFTSGQSVFVDINFAAVFGNPAFPFFNALQAFDPASRTPAQLGFLAGLSQALPNIFPGFPVLPLPNLSLPITFLQGFGTGKVKPQTKFLSLFFQDDIKLAPNFLLKLGVRYDLSRLRFYPNNNGNISPRIAFSYNPNILKKNVTIHGAYGLFYNAPYGGLAFPAAPSSQLKTRQIIQLPLPLSILAFNQPGRRFADTSILPQGLPIIPQLSPQFQISKDFQPYYSQQTNFGIDYRIDQNTIFSTSYDFVRGLHIFAESLANPIVRPIPGDPVTSQIVGRFDPTQGNIILYNTASDSYYHALTLSLNRRLANNFTVLAHYTFSKSIDNSTDIRTDLAEGPVNPFDLRAERGLSLQDTRHRAVVSAVYNFSYGKNQLFRDYTFSTIINLESGHPYNLLAGADLDMNGDIPPFDRPASLGRNVGELPGTAFVDFRVTKKVTVNEHFKVEAFVEAFNLFNRTNISSVARIFPQDQQGRFNLPPKNDSGRFTAPVGNFRSAFRPRQFQFGFRLDF